MTSEPVKVLDFFRKARVSRMIDIRDGRLSPSREHPKFEDLYGNVNRPLGYFNFSSIDSSNRDYSPDGDNDGPSAA